VRRAQSASAPAPGVELTDAGTGIVLRGWPATPRPSDASAAVRIGGAQLVPALAGLCGAFAVMFVMGGIPTVLGATMFGLNFVLFAAVLAYVGLRVRRNASAVAVWRVTPTGVSITQGSSRYEVPRAAIRSIDLATALGVPYLTITAGKSTKPDATLIPDDWGGRSPEEVLAQIRAVLRPEVPGIGGSANAAR
jgi:hypothetical protein